MTDFCQELVIIIQWIIELLNPMKFQVNRMLKGFHYTLYQRPIIEMKLPGKYFPVCGQLESNMPIDRYRQTQ